MNNPVASEEKEKEIGLRGWWPAVKDHFERFKSALNMTALQVTVPSSGLIVHESLVQAYDDGRAKPEFLGHEPETNERVVFIPTTDRTESAA